MHQLFYLLLQLWASEGQISVTFQRYVELQNHKLKLLMHKMFANVKQLIAQRLIIRHSIHTVGRHLAFCRSLLGVEQLQQRTASEYRRIIS
jgi:hypothetical protein